MRTSGERWLDAVFLIALTLAIAPMVLAPGRIVPGAVWIVVLVVPLWWRRSRPDAVMAVLVVLAAGQLLLTDEPSAVNVTFLVGIYSAGRYGAHRWRFVWPGVALAGAALGAVDWSRDEVGQVSRSLYAYDVLAGFSAPAALALLAWGAGVLLRQRADLRAGRARAQDQQIRLAVAAERSRLARDVHDVVGHRLSRIAVQAERARYRAEAGTEIDLADEERLAEAGRALARIRQTAKEALDDTRSLTAMISRDAADGGPGDEVRMSPAASLADVPDLVSRWRSTGSPVTLSMPGRLPALTRPVELTGYRVVQEGLTNATRHAPSACSVTVEVSAAPDEVVIRIRNDGVPRPAPDGATSGGSGLAGLRARVEAVGGRVDAGPAAAEGHFELVVRLPALTGQNRAS